MHEEGAIEDTCARIALLQGGESDPMRGAAAAVDQASLAKREGTGTDGGNGAAAVIDLAQPANDLWLS